MRSPRTWGWTVFTASLQYLRDAFPTHVGMDRPPGASRGGPSGVPHARGDGPIALPIFYTPVGVPHARGDGPTARSFPGRSFRRSPRTWGWTVRINPGTVISLAFPTHVGMDRTHKPWDGNLPRVPHARGDGPRPAPWIGKKDARSPRTWGWTGERLGWANRARAFPTHVVISGLRKEFPNPALENLVGIEVDPG